MPKPTPAKNGHKANGKTVPATTASKALATEAAKKAEGRPVLFPEIKTRKHELKSALTCDQMQAILGWESEEQYQQRKAKEEGVTDPKAAAKFALPERDVVFKHDLTGRVALRNNAGNRPHDLVWSQELAQEVLTRHWAGPTTMPEPQEFTYGGAEPYTMGDGTVLQPGQKFTLPRGSLNGEAMQISRTGLVKSAQHRGIGFVLSCLEWRRDPAKYPAWPTEPVLETLIVYGVSDDADVTTTMDHTLARTEADSFYSTGAVTRIFGDAGEKLERKKQAEACRMLQKAVDFLWQRIGKGTYGFGAIGKFAQTPRAVRDFLEAHPRLYKAVAHVWGENQNRQLSIMHLSPGECAGALYMMAACKSDFGKANAWDAHTGNERQLDLGLWSKASELLSLIAKREGVGKVVADAVAKLADDAEAPTRGVGKLCIIAKAWERFSAGKKIAPADLELEYADGENGRILVNATSFGGIDRGPKVKAVPDGEEEPTPEQVEAEKKRVRAENAKAMEAVARAPGEAKPSSAIKFDKDGKPPLPPKKVPAGSAK